MKLLPSRLVLQHASSLRILHLDGCLKFCVGRQIEKLVDLPGIRELLELPLLSSVLAGFLPQLVLRLFFSLMPYILAALERLEGLPAESEVEFGVVRKYYAFQVRPARPPYPAARPCRPAPQEGAGPLADAPPSSLPAAPGGPVSGSLKRSIVV